MPLHDWRKQPEWESMHLLWLVNLSRDVRRVLPAGFRVRPGSSAWLSADLPSLHPDIAVQNTNLPAPQQTLAVVEPDVEVAVGDLELHTALFIEREHVLVAVIEAISPRNKDRPASRDDHAGRYAAYLLAGVHLLLVDVHARPYGFTFGKLLSERYGVALPAAPAPVALSYRVGEIAATGGRMLAVWQRILTIGEPLPSIPLALTLDITLTIDLEPSYQRAADELA